MFEDRPTHPSVPCPFSVFVAFVSFVWVLCNMYLNGSIHATFCNLLLPLVWQSFHPQQLLGDSSVLSQLWNGNCDDVVTSCLVIEAL